MILDQLTIPGQVISKKRGHQIFKIGKFTKIAPSKAFMKYEKMAKHFLASRRALVEEFPVFLHFQFVMSDNRAFDLSNMAQGPQDILTEMGLMPDDNYRYCIPVFFGKYAGVFKDKDNPHLTMTFTDLDELRKPDFLEGEENLLRGYRELAEKAKKVSKKNER